MRREKSRGDTTVMTHPAPAGAPFTWQERHTIVFLCSLCTGLAYFDRINLSVAIVDMRKDLGWSDRQVATVLGSFFYGYFCSQILGGILAHKFGGKIVLGNAVVLWSTLTVLSPFFAKMGFVYLIAARVGLGLAEGVTFPVIAHLSSQWVPENERSRSVACYSTGVYVGAILSFIISPLLMVHVGWESVFYCFGFLGYVWFATWMIFAADFSKMSAKYEKLRDNGVELAEPVPNAQDPHHEELIVRTISTGAMAQVVSLRSDFSKICSSSVAWAIFWCHFCHNAGHYVIMSWLPTYFDQELGIHGSSLAFACVPYAVMAVAVVSASMVADRAISSGVDVSTVRRTSTLAGFTLGALFMLVVAWTRNPYIAVLAICLALACNGAGPAAGYEAAKLDIASQELTGKLQSVSNTFATLSGILGVPLVEVIRTATGSWASVFLTIAMFFASAAVVFWRWGKWNGRVIV